MAFDPEPTSIPTGIGTIIILLKDVPAIEDDPAIQEARFDIKIIKNGSIVTRRGNLIPHITPTERAALEDFMTTLRARAVDQILP